MSLHESSHDGEHEQIIDYPKRPYSIDLALELEHQLGADSLPPTPAPTAQSGKRDSLDPHILASIVMQLRQTVSEVTKERDELQHLLSDAHSRTADLKDALELMSEKCSKAEGELEIAKKQTKEDEEAISMLRSKVEESRRGLMRLQTETRRTSMAPMTIDMSRAGAPSSFGGPPSSKRMSFTPLTGTPAARINSHRRVSSISDPGNGQDIQSTTPTGQTFNFQDITSPTIASDPSSKKGRRVSGFFARGPSPETSPPISASSSPVFAELEALRQELKTVTDDLDETKHQLTESNEAREASETCVKALREFIAENNVGVQLSSSDAELVNPSREDPEHTRKNSGWGFKLWKVDTTVKPTTAPSTSTSAATTSPESATTPRPDAALTRKFGNFFGSRGSVSSMNAPAITQNPSYYNSSDTSSIVESLAEPISPTSETAGMPIIVRDGRGSLMSESDLSRSPELMKEARSIDMKPTSSPTLA